MHAVKRVLTVIVLACASFAHAAWADAPRRGGTLIYGISAEAPTFDCGGSDTFAVLHSVAPFYSQLLDIDLSAYPKVVGDLAKSWTISPDGRRYSFQLHEGVTFHDGSPLTAADIKASYDRYRNPPAGVVSFRQATLSDIEAIETPSPTTVVFKLRAANPAMLLNLASPSGCIYSAAKLAQDPNYPARNVLGTGPFQFSVSVKGSHIAGIRNENYFRKGEPYLDGFRGILFTQSTAMVNAIQGGQVMGEFRGIGTADKDRLRAAMGDKVRFYESDWSAPLLIVFNISKPPFDDVRVRRALSLAVDRHAASQGLRRTSVLRNIGGLIRPGAPFAISAEQLEQFPGFGRDINAAREEAKRLLKEAGVDPLKFVLFNRSTNQPYTPAGVFLIDQWRQIGVEVEHKQVETAPYREGIRNKSFDVAVDFTNAVLEDPALTLTRYLSGAPDNPTGAEDKEVDACFEQLTREMDPIRREALVRCLEGRVLGQVYQTPLLWWYRIVALSSRVRGWEMSSSHLLGQDLGKIWLAPDGE
jgi:peptide/nickel transport system substrate-binding protein